MNVESFGILVRLPDTCRPQLVMSWPTQKERWPDDHRPAAGHRLPRQRIGIVGDLIGSRVCQPETDC